MRIKLKFARLFGFAATVALLAIAVGASAAGASEFKTASFPVSFLGEGLGKSTFLSEKLNFITCENSHSKGSVESATKAKTTITYLNKCELNSVTPLVFKEACPTITTKELSIVPLEMLNHGFLNGLLVLPASGTEIASFTCSGSNKTEVKVKGSVICESAPINKAVTTGKVICKAGATHGEQEYRLGYNPQGSIVKSGLVAESTLGIFKIEEKDSQTTEEDVTYTSAVEQTGLTERTFEVGGDTAHLTVLGGKGTLCGVKVGLSINVAWETGAETILNAGQCKFVGNKKECENKKLAANAKCESELEGTSQQKATWKLTLIVPAGTAEVEL